jgi:hypothetical protein
MAVESSLPAVIHSHAADPLSPVVAAVDTAFEERWAAWRARGARHDLAVQHGIRVAAVIVAIAAGLVVVGFVMMGAR